MQSQSEYGANKNIEAIRFGVVLQNAFPMRNSISDYRLVVGVV